MHEDYGSTDQEVLKDDAEDASKKTCLWLKNLPLLTPTEFIAPRIVDGKKRWANQCDSGQNKLGPSDDRWRERSRTYQGIANALADQYGCLPTGGSGGEDMRPEEQPPIHGARRTDSVSKWMDARNEIADEDLI